MPFRMSMESLLLQLLTNADSQEDADAPTAGKMLLNFA